MAFDSVLNLIWVALGLVALGSAIRFAVGMHGREQRRATWLHVVGVALIVTALFPYVSATDDLVQIEHFDARSAHGHSHSQTRNKNESLIRLYETMDAPLLTHVCRLTLTLVFVSVVVAPAPTVVDRIAPLRAGRSPPHYTAA